MNHQRIKDLIERYDAAESSIAEEKELKQLLAEVDPLPQAFKPYATFFGVQRVLAKATAPSAPADSPWLIEESQVVEKAPLRVAHKRSKSLRTLYALAAVLAISAVMVVALNSLSSSTDQTQPIAKAETTSKIDWSKYEITDPAEATRITRNALANVSVRIENGGRITSREVSRIEPITHAFKTKS